MGQNEHATSPRKGHRQDSWNQLTNAVQMAAKQDQIVWTIFGVFWAANAVLLVALFSNGRLPTAPIGIAVCGTGTILSFVWFIIQRRALRWLAYYDEILYQLERKHLRIPAELALSARINRKTFEEKIGGGIRVHTLMVVSGLAVMTGWLATIFWFAFSKPNALSSLSW